MRQAYSKINFMFKKPVKVILWGKLGEMFVPEIEIEVSTLREVMQCLDANYPTFYSTILDMSAQGYQYQLVVSDEKVCYELNGNNPEVYRDFLIEGKILTISPVIAGSSLGKLFMGLGLVALGLITGGTGFFLAAAAMGLQSIFGGHPDKPGTEEQPKESLIVTGQTNTTAEGNRVPIIVGEFLVGDQLISATYKTEYRAT